MAFPVTTGQIVAYQNGNPIPLDAFETGGGSGGTIDMVMSDTSENAVQNKVIKAYVDGKLDNISTLVGGGI